MARVCGTPAPTEGGRYVRRLPRNLGCTRQRPFPPAMMGKLLVYAYSRGVRSSRQIEEACRSRMDFVFLTSGRAPDLAAASRRGDTTRSARFGVGTRRS